MHKAEATQISNTQNSTAPLNRACRFSAARLAFGRDRVTTKAGTTKPIPKKRNFGPNSRPVSFTECRSGLGLACIARPACSTLTHPPPSSEEICPNSISDTNPREIQERPGRAVPSELRTRHGGMAFPSVVSLGSLHAIAQENAGR
jgi:hypothetical protein